MIRPFLPLRPVDLGRFVKQPNLEIVNEYEVVHKKKSIVVPGQRSGLNIIARVMVIAPDGTVTAVREFQSKSFVANFMACLYDGIAQANAAYTVPGYPNGVNWGWKDRSGTLRSWTNAAQGSSNVSNGINATTGIVIGSGSTPPSPTDYNLATPIAPGISSGQIFHLDNTVIKGITTGYPVAGQSGFSLQRVFINLSGASISISEMGLVWTDINTGIQGLLIRDIFTAIAVPNQSTIVINYTIYGGLDAVANFITLIEMHVAYYFPFIDLGNWRSGASYWLKNISGAFGATSSWGSGGFQNAIGAVGNSASGIVFGTNATAPALTDYKLGAIIAQGTGTGQMSYQAQVANPTLTIAGQVTSLTLRRAAVNNSGATITPTEEALTLSWGAILTHALINGGAGYPITAGSQITGYKTISITT